MVQIQKGLGANTTVSASYVGGRGTNLINYENVNTPAYQAGWASESIYNAARPSPRFGDVRLIRHGLNSFYGPAHILFDIALDVGEGEVVALLGRNGAGKSTTMKAIMGLAPARRGKVTLRGKVVSGLKPHHIARAGLGFVPEDRQIFPEHTVEDNLVIGAKKGPDGEDEWSIRRVYDVFPLLEPLRHRIAGRLSGGEQQMLAIARTLMGNPALLLLDEPSEGLAPIIVQRIGELLRQLRGTGATVLIAEQNMHFCLGLASHATVIDKGQIVYTSGIEELKANDNIRQRYLAL